MRDPTGEQDWRVAPRRRGRSPVADRRTPRRLTREAIIDAALHIVDTEGLDSLTMRRVADELDTGPASLYAHVVDKDELVEAVLDRVIGEVYIPDPIDPARWQEQLKAMAHSARQVFGRHRDIARASLGTPPTGENALPMLEAMLGLLLGGGVSERVAALSMDIVGLYITATAFEESLEAAEAVNQNPGQDFYTQLRDFWANLPTSRFPHLAAMANPLTSGDGDERFEFGLDLLIRGIASTVNDA